MAEKICRIFFYITVVFIVINFLAWNGVVIAGYVAFSVGSLIGSPSFGFELLAMWILPIITILSFFWVLIKKLRDPLTQKKQKLFLGFLGIILLIYLVDLVSLPFKNGYLYLPGQAPEKITPLGEYANIKDQQRQDCVNRYMENDPDFEVCLSNYGLKK